MTIPLLYVENGMHGGGSAESLFHLLSVLDRKRFTPLVVFTSDIPAVERIAALGVETFVLDDWYFSRPYNRARALAARMASGLVVYGARWFPSACLALDRALTARLRRRLEHLIRNRGVALVHTNNNAHRDLWAIEAASAAGVPCVSHLRSFHAMGFSPARAAAVNRHASAYIGYSRSITEFWAGQGLDETRMHVVHNAIGPVAADPVDLKKNFGIPVGAPTIGIVGRIIPERGHEFLLRALPLLRQHFPDLRLMVIGGGDAEDRQCLERLAEELGIAESVVFAGHRADARGIMAALDASVLPYTIEPFGRTVLESWQLGVPVVLSRVGHIADIVSDEQNGLLFGLDHPSELVAKIIRLLAEPGLRQRLIDNGQETCRVRFSIEAQRNEIQAIYLRLLSGQGTPDPLKLQAGRAVY